MNNIATKSIDLYLVSIVIPCYQQGRYIRDAIVSLLEQTYTNWEAIIVDDGSTDATKEICTSFSKIDSRIRYIWQENKGVSAARNFGIKHCRGQYIQFLDADDVLENKKIEYHVSFLNKNSDIEIVYGNAKYFSDSAPRNLRGEIDEHSINSNWICHRWADTRPLITKYVEHNLFPVCCPLIRSGAIERAGFFNESLKTLEDWEYWLRCAALNFTTQFIDSDNTNCLIRTHPESASQNKNSMKSGELIFRVHSQPIFQQFGVGSRNIYWALNLCAELKEGRGDSPYAQATLLCTNLKTTVLVHLRKFTDTSPITCSALVLISHFLPKRLFRFLSEQCLISRQLYEKIK